MIQTKKKTKGSADNIDKHVGQQLRSRRTLMGLSQERLADAIGVTFQQVQKYERGTNRVSASRLYSFSKILDVSIDYFYAGIENIGSENINIGMSDNDQGDFDVSAIKGNKLPENILNRKETIDLAKAYYSINNEQKRKEVLKLVKSMAKNLA